MDPRGDLTPNQEIKVEQHGQVEQHVQAVLRSGVWHMQGVQETELHCSRSEAVPAEGGVLRECLVEATRLDTVEAAWHHFVYKDGPTRARIDPQQNVLGGALPVHFDLMLYTGIAVRRRCLGPAQSRLIYNPVTEATFAGAT
ncbi:unnamed protein product [Phytophthora lilii]|uniref:Unnamed protein product n=1 Tax=Phytophthora lilii TaxID=2077276 RepID=A0A9W7CUP7_9STRA|nr:unnamed protein product [Phytophthora lilii]